jgi:hypothetical protein
MSDEAPELWWSPKHGVLESGPVRGYYRVGRSASAYLSELPADAVRLGPVAGLLARIDDLSAALAHWDQLLLAIRDVLEDRRYTAHENVARARIILDAES